MPKKTPPIDYTNRTYESIRQSLLDYARRYYPDTFRDFNDSSFGLMTLETVSYIGDILSFYLDYASSESFIDSAVEFDNILRHARSNGFRLNINPTAYGKVSLYIQVPALASGLGPDMRYAPVVRRQSEFASNGGNNFLLLSDVDFADTDNVDIVVAEIDQNTGLPSSYALRATGRVISGRLERKTIKLGPFQKFRRVNVGTGRIAEILSVVDAEGHEYFEVNNLSQDVIYKKILNRGDDKILAPNILKPVSVPRRFVVERTASETHLIFGHGTDAELATSSVLDPANTVLEAHGKDYISDTSFDPTNLVSSDSFGIAPANTTLIVAYRENTRQNVNAAVGTVTDLVSVIYKFDNVRSLNRSTIDGIKDSFQVSNEEPVVGSISIPNSEEIKIRTKNYFATQNRCVNKTDYMAMAYAMPPEFGAIKRINLFQDKDSFKRNLNLYVVSEDGQGNLALPNSTVKENLKSWININKMMNDTIDILNATIVNFGIEFQIVAERDRNRFDVLQRAVSVLAGEFSNKFDIGESILISKMYNILNEVDGVEDVVDVRIVPKTGQDYSSTRFNFDLHTTPDGRMIRAYQNLIFELKYPNEDIKGSVL